LQVFAILGDPTPKFKVARLELVDTRAVCRDKCSNELFNTEVFWKREVRLYSAEVEVAVLVLVL
jgi:hypothetical protein